MTHLKPVLNRKIKFGVVGCGAIAAKHFQSLGHHAHDAEIVGVCDLDPGARERAAAQTGAPGFASIAELMAGARPDVVVLTTPSGLHAAQGEEAARGGCSVLTEKPIATGWEDGKRLVETCAKEGVGLWVMYQNRWMATSQLLKAALDNGRFGKVYLVNVNVFWTRPQEYYDSAPWRGTWASDGGALMNQASHYMDLVSWLFGPVESVHAYSATLARKIEAEDTAVVNLKWSNGALGGINVTMLTFPKNLESSITVLGERGTVKIGGTALNEVLAWEFADTAEDDKNIQVAMTRPIATMEAYYGNLIEVLRGQAEPSSDGREGLKSLELLVAAYRSAREGIRIALPLTS